MALGSVLLSGGRLLPGDPGDMRFCEYVLEHSYLWLTRAPGHLSFWDPPFFYPHPNVLAYSETLLGVAPFYWLGRGILGLKPDQAMVLWLVSLFCLNFWVAYQWLRKDFDTRIAPGAIGAFIIAFGSARMAQINHPQMIAIFYVLFAIRALTRMFTSPEHPSTRRFWIPVFFVSVAFQFWAGFYYFYFFFLALLTLLVWALSNAKRRRDTWSAIRTNLRPMALWGVAALLLMLPALIHYGLASKEMARHDFGLTKPWLPIPGSWFFMGQRSWLYSWQAGVSPWKELVQGNISHEHALGIGWVSLVLACIGLRTFARKNILIRPLVILAIAFFAGTTLFFPHVSLWGIFYEILPGAPAVRAISRVGLMTLLPLSLGVALFFESRPRWTPLALALALACILEQGHKSFVYDAEALDKRVRAFAAKIDPTRCRYFYLNPALGPDGQPGAPAWQYAIDAMWVEIHSGVPTINGYSGNFPSGYTDALFDIGQGGPETQERQRKDLSSWLQQEKLPPEGLCWITG